MTSYLWSINNWDLRVADKFLVGDGGGSTMDAQMYEVVEESSNRSRGKVIDAGGGGASALEGSQVVNELMMEDFLEDCGVDIENDTGRSEAGIRDYMAPDMEHWKLKNAVPAHQLIPRKRGVRARDWWPDERSYEPNGACLSRAIEDVADAAAEYVWKYIQFSMSRIKSRSTRSCPRLLFHLLRYRCRRAGLETAKWTSWFTVQNIQY